MSQFNGFGNPGLIDFLRETTETALDLSKNLTAAQSPTDFFAVWTKFAEGQFAAAEKYSCELTGQTWRIAKKPTAESAPPHPAAAANIANSVESENAALLSELQEEVDALRAEVGTLTDRLASLEAEPLKVKFSFGEPPHTGWTPSKVVVLGIDADGRLVELPSTIEPGGFRYMGNPSFWIAIG